MAQKFCKDENRHLNAVALALQHQINSPPVLNVRLTDIIIIEIDIVQIKINLVHETLAAKRTVDGNEP